MTVGISFPTKSFSTLAGRRRPHGRMVLSRLWIGTFSMPRVVTGVMEILNSLWMRTPHYRFQNFKYSSLVMAGKAIPTDPATYSRIKSQVKKQVERWPSAYASGMVVQKYKAAMAARGVRPYKSSSPPKKKTDLKRWFDEKWVDVKTGKPCGSVRTKSYYPTCRPKKRITSETPRTAKELTEKQKKKMIALKQKAKKRTASYKKV
ncbi:hypothetical protein ATCVNTS1_683R [Acanthocystis turfacea Chlorella virus NTS-1]|nr:hypothetical protein ATCVNTS1_683R [Acanthocystis turfacea Chlorella virus NTS-1]